MVMPWAWLMEHACSTAFPQDSFVSGCRRTAACLLPTECGMLKGGALIQFFVLVLLRIFLSGVGRQYFHWGQSMETRLQYLVPLPCFGGADLYQPWSTLRISNDWQAHLENHGSRYCPSCLQNLRSWFLWYRTEPWPWGWSSNQNPLGCAQALWDPVLPAFASVSPPLCKGLFFTTHPHCGNLRETTVYLCTVVL